MMMFLLWKWRLHGTLIPFFLLLFLQSLFFVVLVEPLSVAEDKIALLRFKSAAVDPAGLLSAWNSGDRSPCLWPGVSCDAGFRVKELNLSGGESESGCSVSFASSACRKSSVVRRLSGALSPYVGRLTELRVLSLSFHDFSGELPPEIGDLHQLEVLDLRCNHLTGRVPATFSALSRLNYLNLAGNELSGTIPGFISTLQGLKALFLEFNRFSGKIPDETRMNCGSLERIHLGGNQLTGGIPWSLGNCVKLRSLLLFSNNLEGSIPENLGKIAMLEVLDVSRNSLSGIIPAALGNCLRLSVLVLSNVYEPGSPSKSQLDDGKGEYNLFEGSIPNEVTSLPNLRIIWAPHSNLIGSAPSNWGNCRRLEMVNLAQNFLTGSVPASLSDCKSLFFLDLSSNQLTGSLSAKLPVPCMTVFNVSGNLLSGSIPRFIDSSTCYGGTRQIYGDPFDDLFSIYASFFTCNARVTSSVPVLGSSDSMMFILHDFSRNNFTGTVPPLGISADKLKESPFYAFQASRNSLSGFVPAYIFYTCQGLSGLAVNLSDNELFGELPVLLGTTRCSSLKMLDLAGNSISARLPLGIGHLDSLVLLDLSRNRLTGLIPDDLQQLKDLEYLSLASNNLTGTIPASFALLPSLKFLALHSNQLSGDIPWQLTNLKNLTVLLLDNNNLSGNIPPSFAGAVSLSAFNVSFNNLSGPVPSNVSAIGCSSVMGNPNLPLYLSCHFSATALSAASNTIQGQSYSSASPSPYLSPVSVNNGFTSIEIASIVSASAIVSVLLALVCLLLYTRKCAPRASRAAGGRREVITFSNNTGVPLSFENVVRATGGFNASNCIGNGGFGATYKAEISPGVLVAVKRLSVGRFHGVQQFEAEIRTLGRVRHANLVTLLGFHASETEMFLIYNYLPGGNLEKFIRERSEGTVDWKVLHKIALDIARALAYLHDECVPRILHRDIKPSNILLDNNCTAYLSDFGLARLLGTSETHATTDVAGTFGYVAPEYAMTCRVSDKADVYSYGVVLMELISNKKALDPSFSSYGNGFNIVQWACMLLRQGQARDFFIQGLWDTGPHGMMVETLHLAVMCTVESLSIRPTMRQVVKRLKQLEPPTC